MRKAKKRINTNLPGSQPSGPLHVLQNSSSQKTGYDVRHNIASMPDTHAEGRLLLRVPGRGHKRYGWNERALSEADEESTQDEGPTARHRRLVQVQSRPTGKYHQTGQVPKFSTKLVSDDAVGYAYFTIK